MEKRKWHYLKKCMLGMIALGIFFTIGNKADAEEDGYFRMKGSILLSYTGDEEVVTVPEGVTEIGEGAFASRENLHRVVIPKSLKSMRDDAFS